MSSEGKSLYPIRVVVTSANDVPDEWNAVTEIVDRVNKNVLLDQGYILRVFRWETDSHPGFHVQGPKGIIDDISGIEDCDILIGIFWKKFGTPIEENDKTGTEHEIMKAFDRWKKSGNKKPQIMLYFNNKEVFLNDSQEADQYAKVKMFKENLPKEIFAWNYEGLDKFKLDFYDHFKSMVDILIKKEAVEFRGRHEELQVGDSAEESEVPGPESAKVDTPFFTTNEFFRDNPTDIDKLGRRIIAVILSARLRYIWNDTNQKALGTENKAFMLNIDGPWGVGKTSLFKLLRKELSKWEWPGKYSWITIEFNAWEHQRSNPPWWYLMDQVFRQGLGQLSEMSNRFPMNIKTFLRKINIFLREHWWRLTVGRSKAIYIAIGLLLFGAMLFLALGLPGEQSNEIPKYLTGVVGSISLVLSLVTAIYGIKNSLFPSNGDAVRNFIKSNNDPHIISANILISSLINSNNQY